MTNFQPEQVSDNAAAPSNTNDVSSLQSVYSDLGSSYMRDAASLSGSSSASDSTSRSSTDLQSTLDAGFQNTDQLYGGSPTSGLGASRETAAATVGDTTDGDTATGDTTRGDTAIGDTADGAKVESTAAPESRSAEPSDLQNAMQRRAEHRSDVVHDRPEMSMARSASGGG